MTKTVLDKGVFKRESGSHDLEFPSSSDFFSLPANLISGISGTSGARVLLGSKASLQAISLAKREAPLVQSAATSKSTSFVKQYGKQLLTVKADVDGTVVAVSDDEVDVKDKEGKVHTHQLYDHYNLGRKTFLHNTAKVKVGDKVKRGEILATSNYTDDEGHLALGTNLKTAVMPYRSGNFEDAFVLSESGAKKLEAEQIIKYQIETEFGREVSKNKYVSLFPNKYTGVQVGNIDADGVVKKGTKLELGDPVFLAIAPKTLKSSDVQLGKLSKTLKHAFSDISEVWHYEHPGEVVDVVKAGDLISVNIKVKRGLAVGDKISCVWGAKGVTAQIIPDTLAPQTKDGKPVDIVLNSMSITSRVAPALAVNIGLGKLAEKLGHPVQMAHFSKGSSIQRTIDTLKKHGISDTEELYDPVTGRHVEVLTGPLYFTRLVHIGEDKLSGRGQGQGYSMDMQPTKSGSESSKRVGNLGTTALLSHGASAVLRDIAEVRATKNDDYWRRLKQGLPPPTPQVPFIFNKFISYLQGAGVKVDRHGNHFNILPQTDKDVVAISKGAIDDPLMFKVKGNKFVPEAGGLFDPAKTGPLGENYNHVNLRSPIPNPISEDLLRKLLQVTKAKYEELIAKGELGDRLKAIDLDAKEKEYADYLRSGKKADRDNSVKVLAFLKMLKKNKMHPSDLMLSKIPIIPLQYRPAMVAGGMTISSDVNNLYKDLMTNNMELKDTEGLPPEIIEKLRVSQYHAAKAIYGLGEPITIKNKEKGIRGLLSTALGTKGGSAKSTMFQAKVVNKPVDLVSRAVLNPDAKLEMDEASIPQEMIWKMYAPFVVRRLVQRGVPTTRAMEFVKAQNVLAVQALQEELKLRPGIVTRDPSLHKFNLMGFYLKPNADIKDKTVKLNPLVFKGFNADVDGDQLNIHVPASDEARAEVIDRMLPSRNLLSPKTMSVTMLPSNEAALGLFQASTENKKGTAQHFPNEAAVIKAFQSGKLHIGDRVIVDSSS